MEDITTTDANGKTIRIGNLVRVVDLQMELFDFLEPNEIEDIKSMIGETFPVEEISSSGLATVTKWFNRGPGQHESHTLCIPQGQFELVG
ncbi:hypothetical protein LJR168_003602 [Pseudoxanthomonas sp. LjRoot168]|uniref:hypothetical protein n=1 Tax=unclassified Pseudoxanthomonas TaxID=2645906 RepID=UPI003ECF96AB